MGRKKSTDTPEQKNLRKLLLSLGISVKATSDIIAQADGHYADVSAKACEVEMYITAHPEVKNYAAYAATTMRNFVIEQQARTAVTLVRPAVPSTDAPRQQADKNPQTMELWDDNYEL